MQTGALVAGRYAVEAVAGTGGMCSVYRARDRVEGGLVALKALHRQAMGPSGNADAEERFLREVHVLQELRHPSIVRYLDSGIAESGERFLVMEWLQGSDLERHLHSRALCLAEVLGVIQRIAAALAVAHEAGVIHRDVKPSNIFIVDEDVSQAKLLDFGVARWGGAARATRTGTSVGTPAYMAPEQVRGERVIDARADVFALGCVMYECLTGEPAFVAHNPMAVFCKILLDKAPSAAELVPGLPEPVDALLQRMLSKEPEGRPASGAAVLEALAHVSSVIDLEAAARPVRKIAAPRQTITGDEQRLVNVIVAGAGTAHPDAGEARTVNLFRPPEPPLQFASSQRVNVRFDALSDGSLVALLDARGVATDQAVNAARFALALREEFPSGEIALATGLAVIGKTRLIGEAIDRACQMLDEDRGDHATPRPVRLDEVTAGLIASRFEVAYDARGPLLISERPPHTERTLLGKPTPFVGRARELGMLSATLEESADNGVARVVLVTGPPGSGKSRLLRELAHVIEQRAGVEVFTASGDPMRTGSALDMMAEAVRRKAGVLEGEPGEIRRQKLHALVVRHVHDDRLARIVEFLGALIRLPPALEDSVPLQAARHDPILMGDQLRRALEDLFDACAAGQPTVLVLEDLHWGDQATISFVDRALRVLAERPFFVVAVARPELHEQAPRVWAGHNLLEVQLGPLPRRAAHALAESVLGARVSAERVAEIVDRADGNPFYLEELVRTAATGRGTLSDTVMAMTQARIEALEPEARRILRAASIFGGVFWRGGLQALTGEGASLDRWFDVLVERELIIPAESKFSAERAWRFRHDLVRDAAYSLLVDEDRRLGHGLAGAWLESVGETDARALAEHFERADSRGRALPLYLRAADVALERGDFTAVLDLVARGERCDPDAGARGQLAALRGDACYWRGAPEATERYFAALELLPRGSRRWYDSFGRLVMALGATDAIGRMEELARELDAGGDRVGHVVAGAITAYRLFLGGSLRLGDEILSAIEAAAGAQAGAEVMLAAHLHRARASRGLMRDGDPATFLDELQRGLQCFEELGDEREACFQRANIGYGYLGLGLWADAERELRTVIPIAERLGLEHVAAGARSNLGVALERLGRLREARAAEERAAEWFEVQRDHRFAGASRMYLATILSAEGELERAEAEARASLALLTPRTQTVARAVLARILLARGAVAEALAEISQAVALLGESAVYEGEATVRLVYAEAQRAAGDEAAARATLLAARDRLIERAERIRQPAWRSSFLENVPDHARTIELARG